MGKAQWSPDYKRAYNDLKNQKSFQQKIKEDADHRQLEGYDKYPTRRKKSKAGWVIIFIIIVLIILFAAFNPDFLESIRL